MQPMIDLVCRALRNFEKVDIFRTFMSTMTLGYVCTYRYSRAEQLLGNFTSLS